MNSENTTLDEQFAFQHRKLTRGLRQILHLLKSGDIVAAVAAADALDQEVGPHIEFEERILYPQVAKSVGDEFANQLYGEHETGKIALKRLLSHAEGHAVDAEERAKLIEQFAATLEHAASCGTLLSHLRVLPHAQQDGFVRRMQELERHCCRWTKLPSRQSKEMD